MSLIEDRYSGLRIEGPKWHGFALGAARHVAEHVERCLEWIYKVSEHAVVCEFGLRAGPPWKSLLVHAPDSIPVDEVVAVMLNNKEPARDDARGRYLPEYRAAVVTGTPESVEFYWSSVHEICHGLCHRLLGAVGRIPWSYEGYADLVCDRVIQARLGISTYQKHLAAFSELRQAGGHVPLREMLMIADYGEGMPAGYMSSFLSQAALFVAFLNARAGESSEIRRVLSAAVREEASRCAEVVARLEAGFGKTIEQIEQDFYWYCSTERTQRPAETWDFRMPQD